MGCSNDKRDNRLGVVGERANDEARASKPRIVGTVATDFSITSARVSKRDSFRVVVRMLADQAEGERALHAGEVNQLLVVPAGYLESGRLRRYALSTNIFSSQDERAVSSWVVRSLLHGPTLEVAHCQRVLDGPVNGVWASDHFGVLADLVLPANQPGFRS